MKKVLVGLSIAILALGAMGCNKQRVSRDITSANASQATAVAETITQIEVKAQLNDTKAADANTALTCTYMLISGSTISKAEIKTSGKCNFAQLAGQATPAGTFDAAKAGQVLSVISADTTMPNSAKAKWDCKAINVQTNVRKVGAQVCVDGQGVNNATGASLAGILGI